MKSAYQASPVINNFHNLESTTQQLYKFFPPLQYQHSLPILDPTDVSHSHLHSKQLLPNLGSNDLRMYVAVSFSFLILAQRA
ncbi:unnamed protein product [Linum trigynum]|uniref:Uncharacterized protein n=1 Tax=Linum trigynum TaxID=586398 RepID=A0AAV2GAM8_9ROSI